MTPPIPKRPTFHFARRERRRPVLVTLVRALFLILLLLAGWFLAVLAMGVPASWIREIESRLPETPFVAEADTISYDIVRGVVLREARIYHKGDVGLPLVSASTVRLAVNPLAVFGGGVWLREVWIEGGVIRNLQQKSGGLPGGGTPDFGRYAFRLTLENTRIFGQRVGRGQAEVVLAGSQMRLSRAEGDIGEPAGPEASVQGSLEADFASRQYRADLSWSGEPMALESFLTEIGAPGALAYFRLFQSGDKPPAGDAQVEGVFGTNWTFALALSGSARECEFRSVPLRQVFLNMRFKAGEGRRGQLAFDPLVMIRHDGLAAGGIAVDFTTGDIAFDGYSTCPPMTLARLAAPEIVNRLEPVRVDGAVRIHAGGTANLQDFTRNSATLFLEGQKIGYSRFTADRLAFTVRLAGTSLEVHDLAGECYGGSFTGAVDLVAAWTPDHVLDQVQFSVQGGCQNLDGRQLANAVGAKASERYEGRITGSGRISGVLSTNTMATLTGQGTVGISKGRLFRFPLFGPLSEFLSRLIPGLEPEASLTDATAAWRLEDGLVKSDTIVVGGDMVSLNAKGHYALTNSLNFDIQLKLMNTDTLLGKAVRALTLPVSKLFEFRLKGSTRSPVWYPVNFSSDLFDRLARTGKDGGDGKDGETP